MDTVAGLLEWAAGRLGGSPAGRLEAEVLLGAALGRNREWLIAHGDEEAEAGASPAFRRMAAARAETGVPVAYLTGEKEFLGMKLRVGPGVLVPRPETEGLVERASKWLAGPGAAFAGAAVVDAGCGSGAVAVALAKITGRRVIATDASGEAVKRTADNAALHGVGALVTALRGSWLEPLGRIPGAPRVCAVVSNPPYIPSGAFAGLPRDVRDFEPREALDGGVDGLDCIRKLAGEARTVLPPAGLLALEIGEEQGEGVRGFLAGSGWGNVRIEADLAGRTRYALAEKTPGGPLAAPGNG